MPVDQFFIGIETEGFWEGKAGSKLPSADAEIKSFAQALVHSYNNIRKDMLRADFSHGSHPGHFPASGDKQKWIVALDDAIGYFYFNNPMPTGRKYITTRCSFTICIW